MDIFRLLLLFSGNVQRSSWSSWSEFTVFVGCRIIFPSLLSRDDTNIQYTLPLLFMWTICPSRIRSSPRHAKRVLSRLSTWMAPRRNQSQFIGFTFCFVALTNLSPPQKSVVMKLAIPLSRDLPNRLGDLQRGPVSKLQNRLQFHLSHKFNDEKRLMSYHTNLQDVVEDQLTLASIHYLRYYSVTCASRACYETIAMVLVHKTGNESMIPIYTTWCLAGSAWRTLYGKPHWKPISTEMWFTCEDIMRYIDTYSRGSAL